MKSVVEEGWRPRAKPWGVPEADEVEVKEGQLWLPLFEVPHYVSLVVNSAE